MKVDDNALQELIRTVERFEKTLENRDYDKVEVDNLRNMNREFRDRNSTLEATIRSIEFKTKEERAADLDAQEAKLRAIKKVEYDRGYAAAYAEVTRMMGRREV